VELKFLVGAIEAGRIRVTDHADEEMSADHLTLGDALHASVYGEVIEDYPTDTPYPSCLVFGQTAADEPVHCVWAYNENTEWAVLVTVYRPDPTRWIDWRLRRPR